MDADTNVTAVLRLAPTATNLVGWVSVTNYATVGNGYLVQMPSIGTNTTASGAWFYTAYFVRGTAVYWTGSGRVTITATTSTGADGLVWQEILPPGACLTWEQITGKPATFPPETHQHDYTAITNAPWLEEYTETDPIWTGVSNTVTVGAALGTTAIQTESDPVAMAALAGYQSAAYWPPDATAPEHFLIETNNAAITITGYAETLPAAVVIPSYINGWPVTTIGANAFMESGVTSIGGAGNVVTVGGNAFDSCTSLASVSLPQVQTVGGGAFSYCDSLASVSLPQVQTVGDSAFYACTSLASVLLPQVQTVGGGAFYYCTSLASLYFTGDAPTIGTNIFADITTPNQVTNYVTNPQATGWGDRLGGMPVVRPPLYASNVTAQAFTLGGDTITEWPEGGGETSIIAPLYESGTNITVTSTQSVYSVAVTGTGQVGIDWSGLALDGTGRAEVTLRLNVTEWGGTNVTFSPSLTFDQTPEILVTGVWEFAASTIDGVTTRVRQTWPECCGWQMADYGSALGTGATASYGGGALPSIGTASNNTIRFRIPHELVFVRATIYPNMSSPNADQVTINLSATVIINGSTVTYNHSRSFQQSTYYYPRYEFWCVSWTGSSRINDGPRIIYTRLYSDQDVAGLNPQFFVETRRLDANERAAYAAGWRP